MANPAAPAAAPAAAAVHATDNDNNRYSTSRHPTKSSTKTSKEGIFIIYLSDSKILITPYIFEDILGG
jgi:hypothetical protein